MINYETILSNYEDKLTLMQWLDKVEAALKDATATGFHLNKTGTSTLTFTIDFDDGTSLTSEPVVINQGESVASAAINNGVLTLTLTNGQVISAGNIFNGNLSLNGDLSVSGALSAASVAASGYISGNSISGTSLTIGGNATFASNATVHSNLTVNGETTLNDDLICPYIDVSGSIDCGDTVYALNKLSTGGEVKTPSLNSDASEISAQKPVVEVMTGYGYSAGSGTVTIDYAGSVKNGNKVTFVLAGTLATEASLPGSGEYALGYFSFPSALGAKLIPISGTQVLAYMPISMIVNLYTSPTSSLGYIMKVSSTSIKFAVLTNTLSVSTNYRFRVEATFLLSSNLAA